MGKGITERLDEKTTFPYLVLWVQLVRAINIQPIPRLFLCQTISNICGVFLSKLA